MENQHRHITGYRELDQADITAINDIKAKADEVGALCEALSKHEGVDQRWVAIGRTHLQQGFMALVRSIAQPESF
jgi:hypothetical protein